MPSASNSPAAGAKPPPRYAPAVLSPLDARGIGPCDLLKRQQLIELDLLPDSALAKADGPAETCNWKSSVDPTNGAGIQLLTDSTVAALDNLYITRDTFDVFEPTQVAGHPAVRADATTLTGCVIYTAIADYQGVATGTNLAGRKLADPCAGARRMAEMILSNLPPLR